MKPVSKWLCETSNFKNKQIKRKIEKKNRKKRGLPPKKIRRLFGVTLTNSSQRKIQQQQHPGCVNVAVSANRQADISNGINCLCEKLQIEVKIPPPSLRHFVNNFKAPHPQLSGVAFQAITTTTTKTC